LENINFELLAGEKVAIVGANGTGKTTLMRDILKNNILPSISMRIQAMHVYLSLRARI
jgi:ATP-binding cassette, subfamily F, member 3